MSCTEIPGPPRPPGRLRRAAAWLGLCALSACHTPTAQESQESREAAAAGPHAAVPGLVPPGRPPRTVDEYQRQMAQRLVAANPDITYLTPAREPLLAIPVLEIEVNADGSVRRIGVLRAPSQAADTLRIAEAAVRRAAPFGDVSRVPRPWKFTQTFLFEDDRRFKPRILD